MTKKAIDPKMLEDILKAIAEVKKQTGDEIDKISYYGPENNYEEEVLIDNTSDDKLLN